MTTLMLSLVFVFMSVITTISGYSHRGKRTAMILIALSLLAGACRQTHTPQQSQSATAPAPKSAGSVRTEVGFATRQKFLDHYDKHGGEFGSISREEYLRQAQELRDRPLNASVLEVVRSDGVVTRFDKTTGAFLAFNADLTIRTYFKPNDGEAYFRRQSKRGASSSSKGGDNE